MAETATWILVGISVLSGPAINGVSYGQLLVIPLLILSSTLAAAVGLTAAWRAYRRSRRAIAIVGITALVTACLFLLPYLLWSQGAIPHYNTAAFFAALLVAASVYAGRRYVRHRLAAGDPSTLSAEEKKPAAQPEPSEDTKSQ